MTDIGNIRSFITADSTDFDRNLDKAGQKSESFARKATKNFKKVGDEMRTLGKGLSLAVTLPLAAAGAGLLKLASDAEETQNKFNVVFSSISDDANAASVSLASSFGLASDQSQELLADTGDLLTGFGFSQKAALDLSTQVNMLAGDLASFTNIEGGAARASAALTKALLGERESVKALGISILDVDVKARVLANSQKGLTFESERQAKAFATLQLAQEQSKNAIGDFARSSDSFANQMRIATAETRDMAVAFGQQLMPVAMLVLGWAKDINDAFGDLSPQTQRLAIVVGIVAAAIGPLLFVAGKMISMFGSLSGIVISAIKIFGTGLLGAFSALTSPILLVVAGLGLIIAVTSDVIDWVGLVGGAWDWLVGKFRAVSDFFGDFGKFLADENASIAESSRTAIEIIGKAWLGLKIAWQVVKQAFVGVVQLITAGLERLVAAFAEVAEFVGADELAAKAESISVAMQDIVIGLEDTKDQSKETVKELLSQWENAPAILRKDVNRLVDTFKALPEGIVNHIKSAFPEAWAAYQGLVDQMQAFIDTGAVGIRMPITMGDSAALAAAEAQRAISEAMAMGPQQEEIDLIGIAEMGEGQLDFWLQQQVEANEKSEKELEKLEKAHAKTSKAIRGMWMGVASTYASAFSTMSGLMKENSTLQKLFAAASIITSTAVAIMKAFETYGPTPPGYAAAAVMAATGAMQLAKIGSGGGGSSETSGAGASGDFSDQTAVSGSVRNSQVIGAPESDLDATGDIPVLKLVAEGDDMTAVITRAVASRGAGDGVNTLMVQGA